MRIYLVILWTTPFSRYTNRCIVLLVWNTGDTHFAWGSGQRQPLQRSTSTDQMGSKDGFITKIAKTNKITIGSCDSVHMIRPVLTVRFGRFETIRFGLFARFGRVGSGNSKSSHGFILLALQCGFKSIQFGSHGSGSIRNLAVKLLNNSWFYVYIHVKQWAIMETHEQSWTTWEQSKNHEQISRLLAK